MHINISAIIHCLSVWAYFWRDKYIWNWLDHLNVIKGKKDQMWQIITWEDISSKID